MTTKALGTSVTQKLLALQKKIGVPYANLATVFLIERLLARLLADERLHKSLVFKGGFVSLKVYESNRYTVDLDALLMKSNIEKTLEQTKAAAETDLNDGVWFHYENQIDLETQGEYGGVRQVYRAGIGPKLKNIKKAQVINFDVGIGDPVTPGPLKATTPALISKEELSWSIYPIETMIAEKIHALISLGKLNSRSKDVYDLTVFLPKAHAKTLASALKNSFAYRKTALPDGIADALSELDTKALERGWKSALGSIQDAPEFRQSFELVVTLIRKLEENF